jgi:hypothetical protein
MLTRKGGGFAELVDVIWLAKLRNEEQVLDSADFEPGELHPAKPIASNTIAIGTRTRRERAIRLCTSSGQRCSGKSRVRRHVRSNGISHGGR